MAIEFAWLVSYIERVHERTNEVANALSEEVVDWRPRRGDWTVAELITHIANTRLMNVGTILGRPTSYRGHEPPPKATVQVLKRSLEHSSKLTLEGLRVGSLGDGVRTLRGQSVPAYQVAVSGLIEHEVHHRGQLCEYLAAAGLPPPALYGLHEEDLPR